MISLPFIGGLALVAFVVWLCFRLDRQRAFDEGWRAHAAQAAAHTVAERRNKIVIGFAHNIAECRTVNRKIRRKRHA